MKGAAQKYLFPGVVILVAVIAILSWSVPRISSVQEKSGEQISWMTNLAAAQAKSKETGQPMLIDFFATWCVPCKMLDATTYSDARVIEASTNWVMVRIDVDRNQKLAMEQRIVTMPTIAIWRPDGTQFTRTSGYLSPSDMLKLMRRAERQIQPSKEKMKADAEAQATPQG